MATLFPSIPCLIKIAIIITNLPNMLKMIRISIILNMTHMTTKNNYKYYDYFHFDSKYYNCKQIFNTDKIFQA